VDLGVVDQVGAGGARRVYGEVVCWGYPFDFPPSPTPTKSPSVWIHINSEASTCVGGCEADASHLADSQRWELR
jgi:hypothetical protein